MYDIPSRLRSYAINFENPTGQAGAGGTAACTASSTASSVATAQSAGTSGRWMSTGTSGRSGW